MHIKYLVIIMIFFPLIAFSKQTSLRELDINLDNYKYPFPVKYLNIENQKQHLKMAYMDVKPEDSNGKNVLLLHGKNFNGAYWETTIKELTENGYRVIVPDQIGFGKSSKPDNFQYSFQQLAKNTKELLETLEVEKTALLGHSMGGMLATRFALMYPDTTEKLILENPIGLEDWKLKVPYKSVDWWYQLELKKDYDSIKKYQMENYYDGKWKKDYEKWVNLLAGWTLSPDYGKIAWNSALTYDMIFTQPVVYEFAEIESPTLLIIGTRDRTALGKPLVDEKTQKTMGLYEKLGNETQRKIPNCKLIELNDVGHLPHIEAFDKFIMPLLKFLEQ